MDKLRAFLMSKFGMMWINGLLLIGLLLNNTVPVLSIPVIYVSLGLWMYFLYLTIKKMDDIVTKRLYKCVFCIPCACAILYTIALFIG